MFKEGKKRRRTGIKDETLEEKNSNWRNWEERQIPLQKESLTKE